MGRTSMNIFSDVHDRGQGGGCCQSPKLKIFACSKLSEMDVLFRSRSPPPVHCCPLLVDPPPHRILSIRNTGFHCGTIALEYTSNIEWRYMWRALMTSRIYLKGLPVYLRRHFWLMLSLLPLSASILKLFSLLLMLWNMTLVKYKCTLLLRKYLGRNSKYLALKRKILCASKTDTPYPGMGPKSQFYVGHHWWMTPQVHQGA